MTFTLSPDVRVIGGTEIKWIRGARENRVAGELPGPRAGDDRQGHFAAGHRLAFQQEDRLQFTFIVQGMVETHDSDVNGSIVKS